MNVAAFTETETRILSSAMAVWHGKADHTVLTYEEWEQAEALFDRLEASGADIEAAVAA